MIAKKYTKASSRASIIRASSQINIKISIEVRISIFGEKRTIIDGVF